MFFLCLLFSLSIHNMLLLAVFPWTYYLSYHIPSRFTVLWLDDGQCQPSYLYLYNPIALNSLGPKDKQSSTCACTLFPDGGCNNIFLLLALFPLLSRSGVPREQQCDDERWALTPLLQVYVVHRLIWGLDGLMELLQPPLQLARSRLWQPSTPREGCHAALEVC